jgi:hypothetical protein
MPILLLSVGLLATAGGLVMIGFGIPINAFSLGNTLIVAGTVALSSGLILIGLASAIGQLRRIAEALAGQPSSRQARSAEHGDAMVPPTARLTPAAAPPSPVPTRMPAPPQPRPPETREAAIPDLPQPEPPRMPEPRMQEPRMPEPRFPAAPGNEPLDWLRSKSRPSAPPPGVSAPAEPPMVDVHDEAPLSPRPPQRQPAPPVEEPEFEPKAWPPGRGAGPAEPRPAPRVEQPLPRATPQVEMPRATPQPEMPAPQPEPAVNKDEFELVWPDRAGPAPHAEAGRREGAADAPQPPQPARPREPRPAERRAEPSPKSAAERGPAILKSGVIDGMPYTLYADGSIEAELPQGTVKFASVDALRAHLERHG